LKTLESFQDLDNWTIDETNYPQLVSSIKTLKVCTLRHHKQFFYVKVARLGIIGGKTVKSATNRILKELFSNSLQKSLSLTGKGSKSEQGLRNTNILRAIFGKAVFHFNLLFNFN